jgi:hypothetical protein
MRRTAAPRPLARVAGGVWLAALVVAPACKGPVVPSPLTGQSRYLCCNVRYEGPVITDNFYLVGTLVPVGTPVEIIEVRSDRVRFRPAGHPEITLVQKYGRKNLPFDQFLARMFVETDPRARLAASARAERARGGRRGRAAPPPGPGRLELVERGVAEPGMSREEVIMAIAYPPAHRTPSLDQPEWRYWRNRWDQYVVVFEGDQVARIED